MSSPRGPGSKPVSRRPPSHLHWHAQYLPPSSGPTLRVARPTIDLVNRNLDDRATFSDTLRVRNLLSVPQSSSADRRESVINATGSDLHKRKPRRLRVTLSVWTEDLKCDNGCARDGSVAFVRQARLDHRAEGLPPGRAIQAPEEYRGTKRAGTLPERTVNAAAMRCAGRERADLS